MTSTRLRRIARHLPVLLRGRPLHGAVRYRPFFIVGSGRCGSTLLRAMLVAHPDLHIPPESALGPMVREYRRYSRLPWNVVLRIVLGRLEWDQSWATWELALKPLLRELDALPRDARNLATILAAPYRAHASRHKPSAVRWGDKTPPNTARLGALHQVFPDLQVVHLLRDGRDVVQSFLQPMRACPIGRTRGSAPCVPHEPSVPATRPSIWRFATRISFASHARRCSPSRRS
jgi:hypothetical protein